MYINLQHLRSIQAIHQLGGLSHAAKVLNITQSALSHQIANLENQVGMELFARRSRPLKLSAAGLRMLRVAERVLSEIDSMEQEFAALRQDKAGRLHVAIQCHACFSWLFPVLELFRKSWPDVEIDIRAGLSFDSFPALIREEVDLVITSNPENISNITLAPLFDYHPTFIASADNPLSSKPFITAADFQDQTLITYPVERDKLDVFTELLLPENVEPKSQRHIELTDMILMLVSADRGVAVLPDWVVNSISFNRNYITRPLGSKAIIKRLYAAIREEDSTKPYLAYFQRLVRTEAVKLQRK